MSRRIVRPDTPSRSASSAPDHSRRACSSDSRPSSLLEVSRTDSCSPKSRTDPDLNAPYRVPGHRLPKGAPLPDRDGYIPGVPCWIDTSQPDPEAAVDFYSELFGWEFENVMPPESEGKYFIARIRGRSVAAVGSIPEGAPRTAMWNTYIWVQSADEIADKVRDAGGHVLMEPFEVMDAGRMAVLADTESAAFCVWQAKTHTAAQVVNEHGTLNFNGLHTRAADAAKAFYSRVFGWRTLML